MRQLGQTVNHEELQIGDRVIWIEWYNKHEAMAEIEIYSYKIRDLDEKYAYTQRGKFVRRIFSEDYVYVELNIPPEPSGFSKFIRRSYA